METKSDKVRALVASGEYKKALAIVKGFRIGITKKQQDMMTRAYECMVHPEFYKSLGTDVGEAVNIGIAELQALYG
ncbi:MAG: hypothetical protein K2O14_07425 [Oscillospiraceae bacterium]|nr:hypothetical protein [Oscillospiraceae bacterium]